MKNKKLQRTLSLLLAVVMILAVIPVDASAESTNNQTESGKIVIESYNPIPGETIKVDVRLENNPGIASMKVKIVYDNSVFTLTGVTHNEEMGGSLEELPDLSTVKSPCTLLWDNGGTGPDYTEDGVFVTLTFEVSENAAKGRYYTITAIYDTDEIYNSADFSVPFEVVPGKFVIFDCLAGDIDGNGKVNTRDITRLRRYHAGWDVEVFESVLDVDGNGKINIRDITRLQRYHAGWDVEICCPCTMKSCTHNLTAVDAKAASCTEEGNIAHWYCADCGTYFSDAEAKTEIAYADTVIAATGHTEVIDEAVAPSCTQTGLTEGKHCSVCNEVLVAQTEVAKSNHTPGTQATCTEDQTCTACGEVLESANGHIPGVEASCTTPQTCTVCQAVLAEATGHSLTYMAEKDPVDINDPGNCAYWQCAKCQKCYLDEEATQEIALADTAWKLFKVTYICDENNSKQTQWYKVGLEVEDLLIPQIDGYDFNYWKDGTGKRINSIAAGNSENLELYADVDLKEYTIYLGGTWKYDNLTYNIKQQVDLPVPIEDGLTFAGWRDADGKVEEYIDSVGVRRWRVPKGTTGDIELMAQWKDNRDLVVPDTRTAADRYVDSGYDEAEGVYWFLYSLGEIRNVVLDPESSLDKTNHEGGYIAGELLLAETVTVEQSVGNSVSQTVSHTVTNSTDWSMTESWEKSATAGLDITVTVGAEVGSDFAKATAETAVGVSYEGSASAGGDKTTGGGNEESDETSNTIETNFAYSTSLSQTDQRTIGFTHDVAPGNYYFANVGTVKVYAFVVFDPVTNTFGLETFSVLEDGTTTTVLSDKKENREYVSDALSYDVDIDGINGAVTENFFVQYFANNGIVDENGQTQSVVKMYPRDTDVQLAENPFSYTGYTFNKWATVDGTDYAAGKTVNNLAGPGQMIVMNAQWDANAYSITYNANKPSNASSSVANLPGDTPCVYDENVTLGGTPTLTGWTFGGWYKNAACTDKVGNAGQKLTKPNLATSGKITLYAKWTANTYTVTYNANGGTGQTGQTTHIYDTSSNLAANGFSRTNYTFLGWSTDRTAKTPTYTDKQTIKTPLATSGNVTLYAVWVKTSYSVSTSGLNRNITNNNNNYELTIFPAMDREALKANGYTNLKLHFHFKGRATTTITFNKPRVRIYSYTGTELYNETHNGFEGNLGSWTWRDVYFTMSINDVQTNGSFWTKWSTSGGNGIDGWCLDAYTITVEAVKS